MVSMERDRFSRSSGDKIKADLAVPQSQFCSAQAEESLFWYMKMQAVTMGSPQKEVLSSDWST